MGYSIEKLPNEPVVIFAIDGQYSVTHDLEASMAARQSLLDTQDEPVFCIMDYTGVSFTFDELLLALNRLGGGTHTLYHDPKIRKLLIVASSPILRLSFEGMASSEAFGHLHSDIFSTMEEALEYARSGQ